MVKAYSAYTIGVLLLLACSKAPQQSPPNLYSDELTLAKTLTGTYHVLEVNGDASVGGMLDVVVDGSTFGYRLRALPMASDPANSEDVLTDLSNTQLTSTGDQITQSSQNHGNRVNVVYTKASGYVTIDAQNCSGVSCQTTEIVFSTGGAPGETVDAETFFQNEAASYPMDEAGGSPALAGEKVAVIPQATQGIIGAPYCQAGFCNPHTLFFPFSQTTVTERTLATTPATTQWVFLVNNNGKLLHYSWEDNGTHMTLRDYQFLLNGATVCLEHVFHKGP